MARRVRIKICGYHHIYNRGVAKNNIFYNSGDKDKFIEILDEISEEYNFNIHSFCLMDNHYHLLLENQKENLSDGMRQINSKYAIYFNKKYKRIGHLWQDRYKSWFITDERYLFTLLKYIESNPIKAKMSGKIGEYKYSSSYYILNGVVPKFLQNSFILKDYDTKKVFEMMDLFLTEKELDEIDTFHKMNYKIDGKNISQTKEKNIDEYFDKSITTKEERNKAILKAFEDGYNRSEISRKVGLSITAISKIIKKFKVEV